MRVLVKLGLSRYTSGATASMKERIYDDGGAGGGGGSVFSQLASSLCEETVGLCHLRSSRESCIRSVANKYVGEKC